MAQYKIYFPNDGDCKWLNCIKKGYEVNGGYCFAHKVRGKELGELRQCAFYDKNGFCMVQTDKMFRDRFYCVKHHKLLTEYDKEVKQQLKIIEVENRRDKMIELVQVLSQHVFNSSTKG